MNINLKYIDSLDDYFDNCNGVVMVFTHKLNDYNAEYEYRVLMNYTDKTVSIQHITENDIIDMYYLIDIIPSYQFEIASKYIEMYEVENREKN